MNKQDFLLQLETEYHKVGILEPAVSPDDFALRQTEGFSFYRVGVYDEADGAIKRGVVFFQVQDEGQPTETVYWEERKQPRFVTDKVAADQFSADVQAKIANSKPAGYLAHQIIEFVPDSLFAIVRVFVVATGVAVEKKYLLSGSPLVVTPM